MKGRPLATRFDRLAYHLGGLEFCAKHVIAILEVYDKGLTPKLPVAALTALKTMKGKLAEIEADDRAERADSGLPLAGRRNGEGEG